MPGRPRAETRLEQDRAAGGRERRRLRLDDERVALASVALRVQPNSRRIYAYLRWSVGHKTFEKYLGEVTGSSRPENLAQAWRHAFELQRSGVLNLVGSANHAKHPSRART